MQQAGMDHEQPVGNEGRPVDYKYVSGLAYVPHSAWTHLKIAPTRAYLERHLGILTELAVMLAPPDAPRTPLIYFDEQGGATVHEVAFVRHHLTTANLSTPTRQQADILYSLQPVHHVAEPSLLALVPDDVDTMENTDSRTYHHFPLSDVNHAPPFCLYVHARVVSDFRAYFKQELNASGVLTYDNLVNLCIMVKNGGPLFETMLRDNLAYIDRWTVLDTGSTDGTQDRVRAILGGNKRGQLYEEPFINFRESRNRCLELAGTVCKYNIMLDDTYVIRGDVRSFLEEVRGDEFASSFSMYVSSDDVEYTSNRITRAELGLRYKFKIHEVIQKEDNVNVVVPRAVAYIDDMRAPYMEERTNNRKQLDLQWLHESVEEEPEEPRHLYYLAQTYNILKDYENAAKYFRLRTFSPHDGFLQEQADACFELARVMQFQLKKPWHEVEPLYLKVLELEPRRCDAMYFLGIYHIYDGREDEDKAYAWFERAFPIGYPVDTQYSLKPTLVYYYLPSFLAPLCYPRANFALGFAACQRFMDALTMPAVKAIAEAHVVEQMASWHAIFGRLVKLPQPLPPFRPLVHLLFIVDGNWSSWSGADIETKGLGGSETWAVEMAATLAQWLPPGGKCVVMCKCEEASEYRGVLFVPLRECEVFLARHHVKVCVVSRFSEYVPVAAKSGASEVHLVLHDTAPVGNVIPNDAALRTVFCLTPWHHALFTRQYALLAPKTKSLGYGIDSASRYRPLQKRRHAFVFSSFPNRGLKELLQMWPRVRAVLPDATLQVFCNLQHEYVRRVSAEYMAAVDALLSAVQGVSVRGWVSKPELARAYGEAEYWLYPCVFEETFCLTALEAVACGAIGIAPPLAALQHMPLCFVDGDPRTDDWATAALAAITRFEASPSLKAAYIENGRSFAQERTWQRQALLFANETCLVDEICAPREVLFSSAGEKVREATAWIHEQMTGKLCRVVRSERDAVGMDYTHVRDVLSRSVHAEQLFHTVTRACREGVFETCSPLVQVLRGVDGFSATCPALRGYSADLWIVWTEHADHSLHLLPKVGVLQHMTLAADVERAWATLANTRPLLWKNYYAWGPSHPPPKLVVHPVAEPDMYMLLVCRAIAQSMESTAVLFPRAREFLDGAVSSRPPLIDLDAHFAKLAVARAACVASPASPTWLKLKQMRDAGFVPRVIYDIGACVLEWTAAARDVWPDARVIVFDATPSLATLYERAGLEHHIGVLSDCTGREVRFYQNELVPFGNSYYREKQGAPELFADADSVVCTSLTLDSVVALRRFPPPDLMKIDVQGSEGDVVRGGKSTLAAASRLIVELQDEEYNEGSPLAAEVIALLRDAGFTCADARFADNSHARTGDYEFVKQ